LDCVIIVIEGQGYALPVAMLKVLFYKPEYTI
jgi:hypothetical protein